MRLPVHFTAALCVAVSLACASAPRRPAGEPTLAAPRLEVVRQGLESVDLRLAAQVHAPAEARITGATWELVSDGQVVARGESPLDVAVKPGEPAAVEVPAKGDYVHSAEELAALSRRGGALLMALRGELAVRWGEDTVKVPFAAGREVRVPRLPVVRVAQLDGARYGPEEVELALQLGVENPNPFPVRLEELAWALEVAGKRLADGTHGRADTVAASSTGLYPLEVSLTRDSFGPELERLVDRGVLPYRVEGALAGRLFRVPYSLGGDVKLNASHPR